MLQIASSNGNALIRARADDLLPTHSGITLDMGSGAVGINTEFPSAIGALDVNGAVMTSRIPEPANPPEGQSVTWLSDGVGNGDAGDTMRKTTQGGVTHLHTVTDYSTGAPV